MPYADKDKQREYQRKWQADKKRSKPLYREVELTRMASMDKCKKAEQQMLRKYKQTYGEYNECALLTRVIELDGVGTHEHSKSKQKTEGTKLGHIKGRIMGHINGR